MDPIADLLTRIRNASSARHEKVDVPYSRMKEGVVAVLKGNGLIKDFRVVKGHKPGLMRVYLKYDHLGNPLVHGLKRESRPGLRRYVTVDEIPQVQSGFGVAVLSTNQGIVSGAEAKEKKIGGELLLSVW